MLIDTGALADAAAVRRILDEVAAPLDRAPAPVGPRTATLATLEDAERRHILAVLEATGGNRTAAARILGIERKTLSRKLKRPGTDLEDEETGRDDP